MSSIQTYFKVISPKSPNTSVSDSQDVGGNRGLYGNYSWYQRIIQGSTTRLVRYREYDVMDNDIDVARALDIMAEEMTGNNPKTHMPLDIMVEAGSESNIPGHIFATLRVALKTWCKIHNWQGGRLFTLARNLIKYGDCFFERNDDKNKPYKYIHPKHVIGAIVGEDDVTDIRGWYIQQEYKKPHQSWQSSAAFQTHGDLSDHNVKPVDKDKIIRFSISDDMSEEAPFGLSVLKPAYKVFKQKELLEDSILIYRISRAPEKRAFYIDVGNRPDHLVPGVLEKFRNQIKQKKIPTRFGGKWQSESIYNPQSMNEDFYFATRPNGNNSRVETLPGGCLALDTEIPLLDGRTLTLEEMIKEHEEGKENWIYSVNPANGEPAPGIVSWAGITRENAEVLEIEIDNGEKVIVTPDHKFPIWGKGQTQAKDLEEGDSFISFNRRKYHLGESKYEQWYDHANKKWEYTHRIVRRYQDSKGDYSETVFEHDDLNKNVVYHIDFNRFNNNPNNLTNMSWEDHTNYHRENVKRFQPLAAAANKEKYYNDSEYRKSVNERLTRLRKEFYKEIQEDEEKYNEYCEKVSNGISNFINNLEGEEKELFLERCLTNLEGATEARQEKQRTDEKFKKDVYARSGATLSKRLSKGGDLHEQAVKHLENVRTHKFENQELQFSDDMITIVRYLFDEGYNTCFELIEKLNDTPEFMNLWSILNVPQDESLQYKIKTEEFKHHQFILLLREYGYDDFNDLKKSRMHLHEIPEDVLKEKTVSLTEEETNFFKYIINLTKSYLSAYAMAKYFNSDEDLKKEFKEQLENIVGLKTKPSAPIKNMHFDRIAQYFGYENFKQFSLEKDLFNHRVVSVKKLQQNQTVGTITVDQKEEFNDFHTFALSIGIENSNSGLGELTELDYFFRKMWRALRIPASYMGTSTEDGQAIENESRVGIAYMQEIKFSLFIQRLQRYVEEVMDEEFKRWLYDSGFKIDPTIYRLTLPEPSDYFKSRQQAIDGDMLNNFSSVEAVPYVSKRFMLERYAGWTKDEIKLNETLLRQEKGLEGTGDDRDLPLIYQPETAEKFGFDGGVGGSPYSGGEQPEGSEGDLDDEMGDEGETGEDTGEDTGEETPGEEQTGGTGEESLGQNQETPAPGNR